METSAGSSSFRNPKHHRSKQILNFEAGKGESIFFLILLQLKHIGLILLLTVRVLKSVLHHHQFTDWKSGETPACCRGSAKEVQRETMHRGEEQMPSETEPCGSSLCCSRFSLSLADNLGLPCLQMSKF